MKSSRPYLLRAFYDWIVDSQLTPYLVINSEIKGVEVPQQFVEEGQIILNISPSAIRSLSLANTHVAFSAQFSGVSYSIYAPINAINAIYAKENGRGMVFSDDTLEEDELVQADTEAPKPELVSSQSSTKTKDIKRTGRPNLTIVK